MRRLLQPYRLRKKDRRIIVLFFFLTFGMFSVSYIAEVLLRNFGFTFSTINFVMRIPDEHLAKVTLPMLYFCYIFMFLYYFYSRRACALSWFVTISDVLTGIFSALSGISAGITMGFFLTAIFGDVLWSKFLTLLVLAIVALIMMLTVIAVMPTIAQHDIEVPSQETRVRRWVVIVLLIFAVGMMLYSGV